MQIPSPGLMNRKAGILFLFLLSYAGMSAQEADSLMRVKEDTSAFVSLSTFELMPLLNPWLMTSNPAGLIFNPDAHPGRLSLDYYGEHGDYKRVQQGNSLNQYSFRTERFKKLRKASVYGKFSYDKSFEKGCVYTNINDPYRGTPYLLIDTSGREDIYDREFFSVRGDISTPVFGAFSWGMGAGLSAGLSSQDRDPRPRNKVLDLDLSQGLLFSIPHFSVGVNLLYAYYNEDIEADIVEEHTQVAFFQLHGFDTYTYHVAASFNRLYKRHTGGGEGQVQIDLGGFNSLFGAKYLYIHETADDGRKAGDASWSYIKNDSELEGKQLEFFNASSFRHGNFLHSLNSGYRKRRMIGTEILQRLEQVGEAGAVDWVEYGREEKYTCSYYDLNIDYSFLLLERGFARNMELKLGVNYYGNEQTYFLPNMDDSYRNRVLSASLAKSFFLGRHELALGAGIKMKENLSASRNFNESSFISEKLLLPDFEYLTSDYKAPWMHISYTLDLDKLFDKYFISSDLSFYQGSNELKRTVINFTTGVIF